MRGGAVPAVYAFCEREQISYTIGLVPNRRLAALAAPLVERGPGSSGPRPEPRRSGWSARSPTRPGAGPTRGGWSSRPRRWPRDPTPASWSPPGPIRPQRSTTGTSTGEPENWIKDLKNACFADRLSDHRFWANQFRLLLHAAAYWLLDTLRRWLMQAREPRLQLDTLRLRLLKIGGRVWQLHDRVRLRLASSHPGQPLWARLAISRGLRE